MHTFVKRDILKAINIKGVKNIMADKNETNVCIYCRVGSWEQLTYEKTKPAIIAKDCKVKSSGKANA